ncbi:MAG: GIY-YIG nuclease family protein [Alphaproteobacteria bacterium]|nr:GIY-YIG nuclease family protein [Alphaproteobacteria bacterium]
MIELLPKNSGAYVFFFNLYEPIRLDIATLGFPLAAPGAYAYCGSARGPGGLRARIARHLRPDKPLHWHIDRLTAAGRLTAIAYAIKGSECALLDRLLAGANASVPIPGFGSSDCRRCPSHLARIEMAPEAALLLPSVTRGGEIAVMSVSAWMGRQ